MVLREVCINWIDKDEVCISPGLVLSFQRFSWPAGGIMDYAPSSLGALPVGIGAKKELLLPLAYRECFWIGMQLSLGAPQIALALAVELRDGLLLDTLSGKSWNSNQPSIIVVGKTTRIEGIRRPDGRLCVFARETHSGAELNSVCLRFHVAITYDTDIREVSVRLVDYDTFTVETGKTAPDPLDPKAGYKGWLLP